MAYSQQLGTVPAIEASEAERYNFILRTYQHIALAVVGFIGFEAAVFASGLADFLVSLLSGNSFVWLALLAIFWLGSVIATRSASQLENVAVQYFGLFAMSALYSILFAPLLHFVIGSGQGNVLWLAAGIALVGFAALTVIGRTTVSDLSWMRPMLIWGGFIALGLIVTSAIFGMYLGVWFSWAMVCLSGMSIIYQTQTIVRRYPSSAYVGAAVVLFSSLMTMFYYIVSILMSRD